MDFFQFKILILLITIICNLNFYYTKLNNLDILENKISYIENNITNLIIEAKNNNIQNSKYNKSIDYYNIILI
uniref:Uncharacterized protein n=1 Tax=viral metagenome TaxID=1070528 RepID=A0A6C0EDH1_9ZZZZ